MRSALKIAFFALVCAAALALAVVNPLSPARIVEGLKSREYYDEQADAKREVAAARRKAEVDGKLLLLEFGGNWCPHCRALGRMMESPEVRRVLADRYEVVWVDVGRFDKNLDIYEPLAGELVAVPASVIVDPASGAVRNPGEIIGGDETHEDPEALAAWLLSKARQRPGPRES
jgi:thiol-disulfide isomerase/thioredoxin